MAYQEPGTRFFQVFEEQPIAADLATLPGCIIGPLYNVTEQGVADDNFDPLDTANQTFTWPDKLVGTVVDLAGTRNGLIDSQRRTLAPLVPSFWLRDGTVLTEVDDAEVSALDQTGFTLAPGAKTGAERADIDPFVVEVNGEVFLYNQGGGLNVVQIGDKLNVNTPVGPVSGIDATVDSFNETEIRTVEDLTPEFDFATSYVKLQEDEDAAGAGAAADTVTVTTAPTAGRVFVTLGGAGAETYSGNGVAVGDFMLTGKKMVGLSAPNMTADWLDASGGPQTFDNVIFGVNIDFSEIENYVVKVTDTSNGQTYWSRVTAANSTLGTLTIEDPIVTRSGPTTTGPHVDGDPFEITIYKGQVGYIEDITTDNVATVVVPSTFADSATFAYVVPDTTAITVYPDFEVLASYRALRKDLVGQTFTASSSDTIKLAIGLEITDDISYLDELAFAAEVFALAQPTEKSFFFIPVDAEPGGTTGLPENRDLDAGYVTALNLAKSVDCYQVLVLDRNAPSTVIEDALETHVTKQSAPVEKHERRGFFYNEMPLGQHNRITGLIEPGRTLDGFSSGSAAPMTYNDADDGNNVIRDINLGDPIAYVTGAGVVAGTEVVIEFPSDFAGERTADGATTDTDLILVGDPWPLLREFQAPSGVISSAVPSVHTLVADSGTPWLHVEAGDYVEGFIATDLAGLGATKWYRLRVVAVNTAGDTLTLADDIAGDVDFTGGGGAMTWISIIRTWGPSNTPSVRYHIDPLSLDEQVAELVAIKSQDDRRFSTGFAQPPTLAIGTDPVGQPILAKLNPALCLVACAAKRSGLEPNDEVTNQFLGGGISKADFAFGHFDRTQMNQLADAGYLIFAQESENGEPYVRDMITSVTVDETAKTEELVTANADFQAKTIRSTFGPRPGVKPPLINSFLLGVRHMQVDSILRSFVGDDLLVSYNNLQVSQNATNRRQVDISYTAVFPVAEKEIEFTVTITV
jgi:hypothetical protein